MTSKIDEELEEINNFVEQVLFYARLDQVSNDYMIKMINLKDVVKTVLAKNKKIMIQNQIKVDVKNVDVECYSDEKWLEFIINQIINNSIKYKKENGVSILIEAEESEDKD